MDYDCLVMAVSRDGSGDLVGYGTGLDGGFGAGCVDAELGLVPVGGTREFGDLAEIMADGGDFGVDEHGVTIDGSDDLKRLPRVGR